GFLVLVARPPWRWPRHQKKRLRVLRVSAVELKPLFAWISEAGEGPRHFFDGRGILDGGGHGVLQSVGDLADGAAENLSRARLGQLAHHRRQLEEGHRPDALA